MYAHENQDDIVAVLLDQHNRIRAGFDAVRATTGPERQDEFDGLRALLAVHETAEQLVLRPLTRRAVDPGIAEMRNAEEKRATSMLAELEDIGVDDERFDSLFATFEENVLRHARAEEAAEFPQVIAEHDADTRDKAGRTLRRIEAMAPTHPHPSTAGSTPAQLVIGPFAAMTDRIRDALERD